MSIKEKVIMFGAGGGGRRLYSQLNSQYDVIYFLDNDKRKIGTTCEGKHVYFPSKEQLEKEEFSYIIISSVVGYEEIEEQLKGYGVSREKIITRYVDTPIIARNLFCQNLGKLFKEMQMEGSCAEAGVFQGSFAKEINRNFPEKKLYLFDTFEGFDERDVAIEESRQYSGAQKSDYHITSEKMVMDKMSYPNQCIIRKGFFPETAEGIEDIFCFVNLDLDLYKPTLAGLRWFSERMVKGGIILVHDYFTTDFKGVKNAVNEFIEETSGKIGQAPIGDNMSIMLYGF